MKRKSLTYVEQKRRESALVKMQVQNLLSWTDMQYASFQQEMGLAYLSHHYGDAPLVDRIPEHREFWGWWRMHWTQRELEFLEISSLLFPHELEGYYKGMHDPTEMDQTPHGIILDNTYDRMMSQLIANALKSRKEVSHG